jgi:signal transduction histidine kinase
VELARDRRPGDPAVAGGLAAIDAAAADMQQIIETLLKAARAGTRATPGRCRPAAVLGELLAGTCTPPGVRVGLEVDPGLTVGVDGALLQRLLAPVLDNALRYARTSVTVDAERRPDGVLVVIEDDGPGVAAEDADRVFEPGWRADPADAHPGGGLGLALTRRLAEATAATVACRPRGPGGRFEVQLPAG